MAKARTPADDTSEAKDGEAAEEEDTTGETQVMPAQDITAPEGPPSQKGQGENAQYSVQRLTESATDFLGVPSYVVAGAFAEADKDYYSVDEAKKVIDKWLGSEVATGEEAV